MASGPALQRPTASWRPHGTVSKHATQFGVLLFRGVDQSQSHRASSQLLTFPGIIVANFGAASAVQDASGEVHRAVPLKKLPLLVAGDNVHCEGASAESLRVIKLQPRSTVLERLDRRQKMKPLAANLTRMVIISAVVPEPESLLIDQFCVAAESAGIEAVVVINKSDLADKPTLDDCNSLLSVYSAIGYTTALINTRSAAGLAPLRASLREQSAVLVGLSGVGKSSIIKSLLPDQDIRIGAVSAATGIGAHTTTVSFRYELDGGGVLIDSPGVRQFSVEHLSAQSVAWGYREITDLAAECRFSDCAHRQEPGCRVIRAFDAGEIAAFRYRNFRKLSER